jgi:N-acetylmuramic acid 6-phosphate etherase
MTTYHSKKKAPVVYFPVMLTEKPNPLSKGIDRKRTADILELIHREDLYAFRSVGKALGPIGRAAEDAVRTIRGGGKVYYIGAGTSGRLGVLDAAEVPPTFGADAFKSVIAGGRQAVYRAVEGAEDDIAAGRKSARKIGPVDMAVGISASGKTPFVLSALETAKENGARCWLIACGKIKRYPFLDGLVRLPTGPEVVAGSTRMKAGTATKLALNMLSTATMIRLGHVYDGLMVDVMPTNKKLVARAKGIIMKIAGCSEDEAAKYLLFSGMKPKVATVMAIKSASKRRATRLLREAGGSLRKVIEGP